MNYAYSALAAIVLRRNVRSGATEWAGMYAEALARLSTPTGAVESDCDGCIKECHIRTPLWIRNKEW